MNVDRAVRFQIALCGGIIGGLFAFIAIYNFGSFITNDKPLAYVIALCSSLIVIVVGTNIFSQMLEVSEKQ